MVVARPVIRVPENVGKLRTSIRLLSGWKFLVVFVGLIAWSNQADADELYCLIEAIYFEGRSESVEGQLAIANVVLNRVRSKRFPDTVCGVVRQCQFSYYCDGKTEIMHDKKAKRTAHFIAKFGLDGMEVSSIIGATHYHAEYVKPYWVRFTKRLKKIGKHIFYVEE
tara:strand:+ start:5896 stop:6396 length:501 start_codon:yes stop_codon:yes gene_type:complete